MEFVIVVTLVGGLLFFILRSKDSGRKIEPPSRPTTFETKPRRDLKRFDAESSQPEKTVLQGTARVVDGDTIVIRKTQIRLFGVDAPEIDHPYGKKAKWTLVSLCKGQTIKAEVTEKDAHGRTVAKCTLPDGRDLSAEMVKLGLAIDWPKFSGGVYRPLEHPDARKKLWLADARQKGRIHVWKQFEAKQAARKADND